MSTSYFFVCDKHKKGINIAEIRVGRFVFYYGETSCMKAFTKFLDKHMYCNIRFICEDEFIDLAADDLRSNAYKEIEW